MRAGRLRHRLTIVRVETTADDYGEDIPTGETVVSTQWGELRPLKGRELEIAKQLRAETTHAVELRRGPEILPTDWIRFNGRRFEILEILDEDERGITYKALVSEVSTGGKVTGE